MGDATELLGLIRPSYSHLRRYVRDERDRADAEAARREAVRELIEDVAVRVLAGRPINPYIVEERLREAGKPGAPRTRLWL